MNITQHGEHTNDSAIISNDAQLRMSLSITTDYKTGRGDPAPYLERIAQAGFTHIMWCHEWNTDHEYGRDEIAHIGGILRQYGLQLLDLHGSAGQEKRWMAEDEGAGSAGIDLVKNRLFMTAELGGNAVVMHLSAEPVEEIARTAFWRRVYRRLDTLVPHVRATSVRLALENLEHHPDNFPTIRAILAQYPPDFIGLCYDSGHGNVQENGLDNLESVKDRLLAVHLDDNGGEKDDHMIIFRGTVDWNRLVAVLARSAYADRPVSMEVGMRTFGSDDETMFLRTALQAGSFLAGMIRAHRLQAV